MRAAYFEFVFVSINELSNISLQVDHDEIEFRHLRQNQQNHGHKQDHGQHREREEKNKFVISVLSRPTFPRLQLDITALYPFRNVPNYVPFRD